MEIKREQQGNNGAFYIEENGHWVGELIYAITSPGVLAIYHTEVSDLLKGKHAGAQLVKACILYARDNNFKINALCPFAKAMIEKDESLHDVLA